MTGSVVPYCPCGCLCVFEFDVLVSVLECGSTFSLRTQDVSLLIFALSLSLSPFLLFFSSISLSLFLSLSSSLLLSPVSLSFDNGVSAGG